jgi:TM2 domain-containing membrane protein YozV
METAASSYSKSPKSATIAILLAFYFGIFGVHRFYVGKIGTGILMLFTLGGLGVWALVDFINIAYSNFKDDNGNYLEFDKRNDQTNRRVLKTVLLILSVFMTFLVGAILIAYLATAALTDVARAQLDAIRSHDYSKAYSYTSSQFQEATTEEDFEKFVKSQPVMMDSKHSSFNNREIENNKGMISGKIVGQDGEELPVVYYFVKEGGVWKIISIELPSLMKRESNDEDNDE